MLICPMNLTYKNVGGNPDCYFQPLRRSVKFLLLMYPPRVDLEKKPIARSAPTLAVVVIAKKSALRKGVRNFQ